MALSVALSVGAAEELSVEVMLGLSLELEGLSLGIDEGLSLGLEEGLSLDVGLGLGLGLGEDEVSEGTGPEKPPTIPPEGVSLEPVSPAADWNAAKD